MKKLLLLLAGILVGAAVPAQAVEYAFDKAHTHIGFSVKHILGMVPGEFRDYDGAFSFDEKKPEAANVKIVIKSDSINTDNEMRDKHLRSPDFFDTEKFPDLTFVGKKNRKIEGSENKYALVGDLTLHGVTKPVTLNVEYLGSDSMMGAKMVGFSAATRLDRRDFGLSWSKTLASGNLVVGNDVNIVLDVSGMEKGALEKMKKIGSKKKDD